jgi:cytochrome c556
MKKSALIVALGTFATLGAETPSQTPPAPSPARRAIDERQAIYTLMGSNFRPVGEFLQGRARYDPSELRKRASRVAFLAGLSGDAFPDVSNAGAAHTRAKADIWTNHAEFTALLTDFIAHAQTFAQIAGDSSSSDDAFRKAAVAVAQDCRTCHDKFREK